MNTHKFKKMASAVGLALGLTVAAGSAQSAILYSFEDDDIDFVYRLDDLQSGSVAGSVQTSGAIQVGDIFISPFEIDPFTIGGVNGIPAGQELTGLAAVQLLACVDSTGVSTACSGSGTSLIYGAASVGLNAILGLGGSASVGAPGDAGGGALIAMFLNGTSGAGGDIDFDVNRTTNPASNCTDLADCIDQSTRGTLFQVDGFTGDPDEFWAATLILNGAGDIGTVLAASNDTLIVGVNWGLGNFFQLGATIEYKHLATGLPCGTPGIAADGCVQFTGSATITGGAGLENGAFAHSDFDATKLAAVVPEPGILALLGLGLAGLGFGASRRNKVA